MSTQRTPEDPHEGSEDDPRRELDPADEAPVAPPGRYEPAAGGDVVAAPRREPTVMDRLESASGPLAVIAFFVIGFGTGMWYVAWVVFLIPAALHAWNKPSKK
ncbi:hypothetical protein GA707_08885 [Nostocoides sp. F2B08]|uniref:hypothetical protein n=1 Tax=Nostocoides sp. F2B08 TaxID=2653936 RepID=UPI0012639FA0|nr:hypothetical protein [Tetrasphaera sp. F2B08]KAB7744693.1 hypothetical protein GA707_08885 [Tetrasphaera sp. F2B08]